MKGLCASIAILWLAVTGVRAKESIDPVISPALFRASDEITVVYDVTGTPMEQLANAWVWVWIPGANTNALYNVNPASGDVSKTNNAKCVKSLVEGRTLFTIVFTPAEFFATDIGDASQLGILLKGNDWNDGQTTDYVASFWDGGFELKLISPGRQHLFVSTGESIAVTAETPVAADFELFVNDVLVDEEEGVTNYSHQHVVSEVSGFSAIKLVATANGNSDEAVFYYIISAGSPEAGRPPGIIPGINYTPGDETRVTLCLWAPGKSSVYALGDFSEWKILPSYLMNRDGEYFWIEVEGLDDGREYGYQYLIDEQLYAADPYADKILDPDDQYIPAAVYPALIGYPPAALHNEWYFNRVSVLRTGQEKYAWQSDDYDKPAKEELVIYELLIRDFFSPGQRSYENLIDTVTYFKRLGVNAVELMPVMEFNGNEGWGYNPAFMFAPDKYYGPGNMLKAFIDRCHEEGIAVILDIAMNHQDLPNPYAMMDFDFNTMKPTPDNRWFNPDPTHPFNVFYDLNHESPYTQAYLDTVTHYWIHEYHVDGYRFDLSKGFTQTPNPSNVSEWSAYDASRIALIKRMADAIWAHSPEAFIVLEHFAANEEERELVEYRSDEGKGMMVWGNLNHAYNQNTMGYAEGSDISWIDHNSRDWSVPHVIGYMESHDEERLVYKNLTFGNEAGGYSVKDGVVALERMKGAGLVFYTLPGPKMIWQFGEFGYPFSINRCEDGSVSNDCRLSPKPVGWDLTGDAQRQRLFRHTADLLRLRHTYPVFTRGEARFGGGSTLVKQVSLKGRPYTDTPSDTDEMNVQIVVNFDTGEQGVIVEFPHAGTWYDYYAYGAPLDVAATTLALNLRPGEYRLFTDVPIENPVITGIGGETAGSLRVYPNPADKLLNIETEHGVIYGMTLRNVHGQRFSAVRTGANQWDIGALAPGFYITEIQTSKRNYKAKIIKR